MEDMKHLLRQFSQWKVDMVSHVTNNTAHTLAKLAVSQGTTGKSVLSDDSMSSLKAHKSSLINISDDYVVVLMVAINPSVKTK